MRTPLSRSPLPSKEEHNREEVAKVVATLEAGPNSDMRILQQQDPDLHAILQFLETGLLPQDEKEGRALSLAQTHYTLEDGILFRVMEDGTLRVIPPKSTRQQIFHEAHGGAFGGHLGDAKIYSQLKKHYWWPGMRSDVSQWTRACLVCATRGVGRSRRPPLTPIPVAGPFDRVGVDVIQFPRSNSGNQYAVVFVDYLTTKWPEVFAVPDQSAATIANLLVREIISRHGVPSEILSDRGRAFLSGLLKEVEVLLGFHKANTSAYHPQTDGLVERFNLTLTNMLAKTVDRHGRDWDKQLPFVLFAYRAAQQQSTGESPFYLLYGRDPRLPTEHALNPSSSRTEIQLQEYGTDLHQRLMDSWGLAREAVPRHRKDRRPTMTRRVNLQTLELVTVYSSSSQLRRPVKRGSLQGRSMAPTGYWSSTPTQLGSDQWTGLRRNQFW